VTWQILVVLTLSGLTGTPRLSSCVLTFPSRYEAEKAISKLQRATFSVTGVTGEAVRLYEL